MSTSEKPADKKRPAAPTRDSGSPAQKKARGKATGPGGKNTADENVALQALLEVGGSMQPPPGPSTPQESSTSKALTGKSSSKTPKVVAKPKASVATPKPERSLNEQGKGRDLIIDSLTPSLCGAEFGHGSGATTADIVLSGRYFTIKCSPGTTGPLALPAAEDYYQLTLHMADENCAEVTREFLNYNAHQPDRPVLDFRVEKENSDGPRSITMRVRVWVASKQVGNRLLCVGIALTGKPSTRVYTSGFRSVPKLTKKHKTSAREASVSAKKAGLGSIRQPAPVRVSPVPSTLSRQNSKTGSAAPAAPGRHAGASAVNLHHVDPIVIHGCNITPTVELLLEIISDPVKAKEVQPVAAMILSALFEQRQGRAAVEGSKENSEKSKGKGPDTNNVRFDNMAKAEDGEPRGVTRQRSNMSSNADTPGEDSMLTGDTDTEDETDEGVDGMAPAAANDGAKVPASSDTPQDDQPPAEDNKQEAAAMDAAVAAVAAATGAGKLAGTAAEMDDPEVEGQRSGEGGAFLSAGDEPDAPEAPKISVAV